MNNVDPSKVYRLLYPTVPGIVACSDGGQVYAMSVVSIVSLSSTPALVGVSSSPSHSTHKAIVKAGRFSVSWVDASSMRSLEVLGTTPHADPDKLRSAGLRHTVGEKLDVPVVEEAVASLECSLQERRPFGDHELLVGRVVQATASEDFEGYWKFESYNPVLYAGLQDGAFKTFPPREVG